VSRISALDEYALDLRRAAVALAVVAAHVALVIVMLRSAGHSADVVDITLFALPITPEDRPREPVHVQKPPISRASGTAPGRAAVARESATEQHVEPSLGEDSRSENDTLGDTVAAHVGAASEPVPPIDWYAEIETSAHTLEQHDSIESGRRSLAGPTQHALSASPKTPACPFERCEPGWGANLGVFESQHSKAGRIEKVPGNTPMTIDGSLDITGSDTVLWINNWCYSVLVSADRLRRGGIKCVAPLGKTPARGDLFDHMNEGQPPKSHDTEVPWISFGLSFGASR
jgi:hypothetical protein